MYRKSDQLEMVFFGLAFILIFLGIKFSLPILTSLGGISLGSVALIGGLQAIRTKRLGFETRQRNFGPVSTYTGLSAQLWGILLVGFALLVYLLVGIAALYPGGSEAFWSSFFAMSWGWGILLVCIGISVATSGVITLLAGSAGYYHGLADRIQRISGVIPLFFGSLVTLVGLFLIFLPGVLASIGNLILSALNQWFFH